MSAYPAYNYDNLARNLSYSSFGQTQRQDHAYPGDFAQSPLGSIEVIPGGAKGKRTQQNPQASPVMMIAKLIVAAIIAFAGIGFARITFSSMTVAEALEAREITKQLDVARSGISDLEVKQSTLTNPTRIKAKAEALNMASPINPIVIDLSGDVVVADDSGTLLLTDSLAALAEIREGVPAQG